MESCPSKYKIEIMTNHSRAISTLVVHMASLPVELPPGLELRLDFVSENQEEAIIAELDQQEWNTSLSRRTQHYGQRYDYTQKTAVGNDAPPLTGMIDYFAKKLGQRNIFGEGRMPEQCIVNEYYRTQGIAAHTDVKTFGPVVVSISLCEDTIMHFSRDGVTIPVFLPRRSALIMSGESRYAWKHEIKGNVTYFDPDGIKIKKSEDYRRISLTYRTMV